jgi:hypothetical protein
VLLGDPLQLSKGDLGGIIEPTRMKLLARTGDPGLFIALCFSNVKMPAISFSELENK